MIEKATTAVFKDLAHVWLTASIHSHGFISEQFWRSQMGIMQEYYLPKAQSWVFRETERIGGFYSLVDGTLAALFVLPDLHGQGIGSSLLEHAKSQQHSLRLTVYKENETALLFYRKRGFTISGEQVDAATGQVEYVMGWKLESAPTDQI